MFPPLREALAAQYAAFTAPRPVRVEGCPCCTSPEELAGLVAAPREALGSAQLEFYAAKAMTTVGTASEFRYYWPRLAELTVGGELLTDTEIVFGKPLYGGHSTWPVEEQNALTRLATAVGQWLAADEMDPADVDMWICAIGLLSERLADPRLFLAPLLAESEAASANLRGFVDWNREKLRDDGLVNAFWDAAPDSARAIVRWLREGPRATEFASP